MVEFRWWFVQLSRLMSQGLFRPEGFTRECWKAVGYIWLNLCIESKSHSDSASGPQFWCERVSMGLACFSIQLKCFFCRHIKMYYGELWTAVLAWIRFWIILSAAFCHVFWLKGCGGARVFICTEPRSLSITLARKSEPLYVCG